MSKELKNLAYYTDDEVSSNFLEELFLTHPELNAAFYQVLICYDYPYSSLISFDDYRHGEGTHLLNAMFGLNNTATVIAELIAGWQVYNIYAVPDDVHEWIIKKFTAGKYLHQYTVNTKNINPAEEFITLQVDFRKDDFTMLATGNNKILLAQTFLYSTPDDVLYYLLKICQQFGSSQQEVHISLSGLVDQQSALYRDLYQYFLHVEFRNAEWIIPASANNENPLHFFTSLNDLSKCAS